MADRAGIHLISNDYSHTFQDFLSPTGLRTIALLNGIEPAPLPERFTYGELGCGHGTTLTTLAATNPTGDFHGIDVLPEPVVSAAALAGDGQVGNVHFHEASFAALADGRGPDLPDFDFLVLHGVYTRVSPDDRAALRRLIQAKLKPGGLLTIGYDSLPGWLDGLVVQRLLKTLADRHWGTPAERIGAALEQIEALATASPGYFENNRIYHGMRDLARRGRHAALAEEVLTEHWQPMFFLDLAEELAEAQLGYVGSARVLETFANLSLTDAQRALVDQLPAREVRETVRDYCDPGRFRRDLFVRQGQRLTPAERDDRLRPVRLALKIPPETVSLTVKVPVGEATLSERTYRPIFRRLAEGAATVDDLMALPEVRDGSTLTPGELVGMLIGSGQVDPVPAENAMADAEAVRALNRLVAERAWYENEGHRWALAAPGLGNGWASDTAQRLLYLALSAGVAAEAEPLARFLSGPILARGYRLIEDDGPVDDEAALIARLTQSITRFLERDYPLWRRLAIL